MDIYQTLSRFYNTTQIPKRIIGKSVLGRNIYAFKVGNGNPVGIAQYAIHGREYITAKLALRHLEVGIAQGTLWVLPLTNPDGALLSEIGLKSIHSAALKRKLIEINGGENFPLWKANARGIDLNVNFDAKWGKGKQNVYIPSSENYVGIKPFSEIETRVLKKFTLEISPDYTVSYHTKGEEIYWYFYQSMRTCPRDKRLAVILSKSTSYPLSYAKGSVGGYKDWCIQMLKIPSFTIEVGADTYPHPLGENALPNIIKKNENALYELSKNFYC